MPMMTGGQAVVTGLRQAGITTLFGIPGVHNGGLYDALVDAPDIRVVVTRHEQGAAFMADGYARASGRTACLATITGPGVTNAATGLGEAYAESSPVLHLATTLAAHPRPIDKGELHELRDQSALLQAIVQQHTIVEAVPDIPEAIISAVHSIAYNRPGPASIEIPLHLLTTPAQTAVPAPLSVNPRIPDSALVEKAATLLGKATAPLIFLGSGAMDAGADVKAVAERLHAPVLIAQTGKGAFPESHRLSLGCKNRRDESLYDFLRTRDLLLVVGCRLGSRITEDGRMPFPDTIIQVDQSAASFEAHGQRVSVALHADASEAMKLLLAALPAGLIPSHDSVARIRELRQASQDSVNDPRSAGILHALRRVLPTDGVLVNDMTMTSYHAATLFPVDVPRSFMFPVYFGTLGFSMPAAIGAQLACPNRPVVSLSGDGGFLFTAEELSTAMREQLPVVAVVFNDTSYGAIDGHFRQNFGGRSVDVSLHNPDFVALGRAFGAAAESVTDPDGLAQAVARALHRRRPTVIEYGLPPVPAQ